MKLKIVHFTCNFHHHYFAQRVRNFIHIHHLIEQTTRETIIPHINSTLIRETYDITKSN